MSIIRNFLFHSYRSHNMRGNWDQMEPRTLTPEHDQQLLPQQTKLGNHQQQQQHQAMLANEPEQLKQELPQEIAPQPQAASTTPGWINDRIVVVSNRPLLYTQLLIPFLCAYRSIPESTYTHISFLSRVYFLHFHLSRAHPRLLYSYRLPLHSVEAHK